MELKDDSAPEELKETTRGRPSVTVSEITFSDGSVITLRPDDIVVLVGPNNAGKSACLREIEKHLEKHSNPPKVIKDLKLLKCGSIDDLTDFLERISHKLYENGALHYVGSGYKIPAAQLNNGWSRHFQVLKGFFCRRLKTETRITDSDPCPSFDVLEEAASRPIQMMYSDSDIEARISGYFRAAFNQDLIVFKFGGSRIPLLVGERLALEPGEDPTKTVHVERQRSKSSPLHEQGDGMRSFASVILEMLASQAPTVLLLDEPEAFLHPPQARLLGEFLGEERQNGAQIFIATHSPDVLTGLLNTAAHKIRIVRIHRDGPLNIIKELENEKAQEIRSDSLMKYSSVLSGVFHQRAVICESDADCMLYQALLAQNNVFAGASPDVLFLHASGKHRMATMGRALRALGVPVDVIADIDLLREQGPFQALVEALGGDWAVIEPKWKPVKTAIESRKPSVNADAIIRDIGDILPSAEGQPEFPKQAAEKITAILKTSSPWGAIKAAGDGAIPRGQPSEDMISLRSLLQSTGIWIVPVGELEGFCPSIGGHGPKWVQRVIEERDLGSDPELEQARVFIRAIWSRGRTDTPPPSASGTGTTPPP